jgi:RNA recognition motif-containing protein
MRRDHFVQAHDLLTACAWQEQRYRATDTGHSACALVRTQVQSNAVLQAKAEQDQSDTKVLVRNLAFEATAKDVRTLMEAFGHVKTCRLPKKFDGSKRGFAFVEFANKGEARKAVQSVHGTHLYGRRLLLEYAKEEEGLDELRAKMVARAQPDTTPKSSRRGASLNQK